jgi:hypothetical protein
MNKATYNQLPPFQPNDISSDLAWLPLCTSQDRLFYLTAKGIFDAAQATAKQSIAAATLARGAAPETGDAANIAQAECDIAIAAAAAARRKAENVFDGVRFSTWTKLDDQN